METPLAQQLALSTFTPSTMPPEVLEGMFVQREPLLQSIVQDLAASVDGVKKFLMLVGARGMGKTHFVSLVYHRLKQQPELKGKLLIAWLREEEYGVNSWLYLIVEILRSLGLEGVKTEEQIARLANLPIGDAEYLADRILKEVIGDRTLLIITENIDKLLFGLGEKEQWKFRAFLQETNCCSILATTPKISQDTGRKEKPFFGFFTPIHLPIFTHVDAVAMLINIANLSGNSRLVKFLQTAEGQSRVRALHHLAGGNPRVYALFAQLITEETLEALLPAVLEMLDKLTPYYQSRVESLGQSDDQQKIVMYLTRETRAVTVKEITAQCFISSDRTTSNALKKLKDKGYVTSTQRGREVFYEISEVLMRLCLEMKNARSGDLKLCVDFLRIWYRPKERQELLDKLELDGKLEHAEYFRKSLTDSGLDPILLACQRDLRNSVDDGDADSALNVWRELVAVNHISEADDQRIIEMIDGGQLTEAIEAIEALITSEELYLKGLLLYASKKWQESIEVFDIVVDIQPNKYKAWFQRGQSLYFLGKYTEEIESYDRGLKINPNHYETWNDRGVALDDLGKHQEAMYSYDHAIQINPDQANIWSNRGNSLNKLGKYEEAITNYDRALQINSDHADAWNNRGASLDSLGRYEEAIINYDRALQINSDHASARWSLNRSLNKLVAKCHHKALADFSQNNYSEALQSWAKAFGIIQQKQLGNASDLIMKFFEEELLTKFQQPTIRNIVPEIIIIYAKTEVLPELAVALIGNLKVIQDPKISDYTAIEWLKMWQELGQPYPELALALKMLEVGIQYKQNPKDDRIFLSLPQEMRPLLREVLGLTDTEGS
jgi:tetratricopeptide (TPR) repeat protein/DNA-binding transcriptional ArsR family regulator